MKDTGRADFQRAQARLLGERTKPVAPPETPKMAQPEPKEPTATQHTGDGDGGYL